MILETLPHRFTEELHRPFYPLPRHVKRAIEFMEANLSKPLSIQDIAGGCGVSVRTLHQGFRQFKVTTPIAHLQHLRLEAVHKELRYAEPGQTVAEIALKWGFTHMGRFASDYRKRFGQLPSATLRS
jgi:transcriptional regulator GlxA family with amidase domain